VKALVTGGAGFLGSHLVDRLLAEGHAVDVLDNLSTGRLSNLAEARADRTGELRIHQVDVRGREVVDLIERRQPDVLFHLAVTRHDDVVEDSTASILPALHVLEGARRAGSRKVVVLLDADLYGAPDAGSLPVKESHPAEPVTGHGVASLAVVEYLRLYREQHGVDFTVLVIDRVFGPRQERGILARAATALLAGETPTVDDSARDLLYVDDAVDAVVRAGERGGGLLLNIGRGKAVPVREVVATMAEAAGRSNVTPTEVPFDGPSPLALDAGRARIQLGWEPWTSVEEGVGAVLRWVSSTT
jgi:UDP-glucose 4-epimerase